MRGRGKQEFFRVFTSFAFVVLLFAADCACAAPYAFTGGRTTKETPFYAPGEKMVFEATLEAREPLPKGAQVEIERTGDDGVRKVRRVKAVSGETIREETSLARPGFVRVLMTLVDADGKPLRRPAREASWCHGTYFAELGAGVEPEKLQSVPEPKDFDAFRASERELLAKVPVAAKVDPVAETNGFAVYAVRLDCAGPRPVTGYLTVPLGARGGKRYPARLTTHGWGTGVQNPPDTRWTAKDVLTFEINAHGYELGRDAAYYKPFFAALETPEEKRYAFDVKQNSNRETAYFRWMRLRVMRALQYLKTRPEWNGADLWAYGTSQGGLQTVWAASCGEGVTKASAEVPWCCDIGGSELGRNRGDTDRGADGPRAPWYVKWTPALGYYDPVNHARRVPATCEFTITRAGLGDYVCPPAGISVLYNNLPCRKKITYVQGSTHGIVPPPPNQTAVFENPGPAATSFERLKLSEKVGERTVECELAVGRAEDLRVAVAPDIDGEGSGSTSLVDPAVTAKAAGLRVAINANAFHKVDLNDRNWSAGGAANPFGEVIANGVPLAGCSQKRLMFWVDRANVCHIGRPADFATVREAVSDWGGRCLKDGATPPKADARPYPHAIVGHDATGVRAYLLVGNLSYVEAAEILRRHGASDAMVMDGGGSAVMVPMLVERRRRPVPVVIGFR